MKVNTKIFGEINVDNEKIISFENGIIGFQNLKDFTLIFNTEGEGKSTISWLQSLEEDFMALPVIDPLIIKSDYSPCIEEDILNSLGECSDDDYLVLVTVTVPADIEKISVNLRAPIIINTLTKKACQVITENVDDMIKYPIYDIIKPDNKEGE